MEIDIDKRRVLVLLGCFVVGPFEGLLSSLTTKFASGTSRTASDIPFQKLSLERNLSWWGI